MEPKYQLMPPLSESEYQALKADIAARGVLVAIEKDEQGNTLDGHHREQICKELGFEDYPTNQRLGMSEDEKIYHAITMNLARRHLSAEQRRGLVASLRKMEWSLPRIADAIGISLATVWRDLDSTFTNEKVELPETITGKDGKRRAAHQPKTIIAKSKQQADAALKCVEHTGWPEGNDSTITAAELIDEGNRTLYGASRNRLDSLMTSNSFEWHTPPHIAARVRLLLRWIDLDPCTSEEANKTVQAAQIFTKHEDGLSQKWQGRVFINPPFGDTIGHWITKLCAEYHAGNVEQALALVPARTDTEWFRKLAAFPRVFLFGRLKFTGPNHVDNSAPFPTAIVALGCDLDEFCSAFQDIGDVYQRVNCEVSK